MQPVASTHQTWRERAEASRGEVVFDPTQAEFMAILGQQLGLPAFCPNCFQRQLNQLLGDGEVYVYGAFANVAYHWDIERARAIIARDQLAPIALSPEIGWQLLVGHDATLAHVDHLPVALLDQPIILADALPNAQLRSHALIDGTHRLLRRLRDGGEIRAYLLDRPRSLAARVFEEEILATGLSLFDKLARIVRVD